MLATLFGMADDLDNRADDLHGFTGWGNYLRLWGLIHNLLPLHLDQEGRSALLLSLAPHAQVGWMCYLAEIAWDEHHATDASRQVALDRRFVTLDDAAGLRAAALEAIRRSATTGELIGHCRLRELLFAWSRWADDEGAQVRRWAGARLEEDQSVVRLAEAFTSIGEAFAMGGLGSLGDRVATRIPQVDRTALARVCDVVRLEERAATLLREGAATEDQVVLRQFLEAGRPGLPGLEDK